MVDIPNKISDILNFIKENTENSFLISKCDLIRDKMTQIRDHKIISQESLDFFCDYIIDRDINMMRRVITEENKSIYKKIDELEECIKYIDENYFQSK